MFRVLRTADLAHPFGTIAALDQAFYLAYIRCDLFQGHGWHSSELFLYRERPLNANYHQWLLTHSQQLYLFSLYSNVSGRNTTVVGGLLVSLVAVGSAFGNIGCGVYVRRFRRLKGPLVGSLILAFVTTLAIRSRWRGTESVGEAGFEIVFSGLCDGVAIGALLVSLLRSVDSTGKWVAVLLSNWLIVHRNGCNLWCIPFVYCHLRTCGPINHYSDHTISLSCIHERGACGPSSPGYDKGKGIRMKARIDR